MITGTETNVKSGIKRAVKCALNRELNQEFKGVDAIPEMLITACAAGRNDLILHILENFEVDIHVKFDKPFRVACINGHLALAKIIWDNFPDIDIGKLVMNYNLLNRVYVKKQFKVALWLNKLLNQHITDQLESVKN